MSIRLYDSAWVKFRDSDEPQQVFKNRSNPAMFEVAGYRYDIDARPYHFSEAVPDIVELLTMRQAQELGLSTQYSAPKNIHI
ncbi:MAG: hypothetical protein QM647_15285 [Asticcacaulis sp.]|uniref:hypothetical protein n=1 Tax=Asticcacaulis sp. TaxID=1872648 RepID=UPI0039E332E3